ncbi:DUF4097 family beta strand repeat-containing protein [Alkalihalophilus pseudofirmus]|uniref:DUF4097 family beta strand repeat-containing protein n=1 Tax=Alkalihalophilus pseudofirmus TaxID=79885 RepID=UPI00259B3682|nr:DUF4097 family beta strand repeat-containing protein [Alkalihalophilus pseudofirmus]WEG18135.1 DUF4097 family beta strand repeat-containing protein [Alkalihalophilus pseudofirmus]
MIGMIGAIRKMKKKMSAFLGVIAAGFLLAGCNLVTFVEEETLTLPLAEHELLEVVHEEGEVTITGEEGLEDIIVEVKYEVLGEELEEAESFYRANTAVSLESAGEAAKLITSIKRGSNQEQANIHLDIKVPEDLPIVYRQKEGGFEASNLSGDIKVQHGRGALAMNDISGDITLTDGAGAASFERITGQLQLNINAGATTISDSNGTVLFTAGSGDVTISDHNGDITLRSGNGDVAINNIDGNVTILESKGGNFEIEGVTGEVKTPE